MSASLVSFSISLGFPRCGSSLGRAAIVRVLTESRQRLCWLGAWDLSSHLSRLKHMHSHQHARCSMTCVSASTSVAIAASKGAMRPVIRR